MVHDEDKRESYSKVKKKDKKSNINKRSSVKFVNETSTNNERDNSSEESRHIAPVVNEDLLTCVTVHKSDILEGFPMVLHHPVVKVHFCSAITGDYIQFKFNGHEKLICLEAQVSKPLQNVTYCRTFHCKWEEEILFSVPFDVITSSEEDALVIFQIMDKTENSPSEFSNLSEINEDDSSTKDNTKITIENNDSGLKSNETVRKSLLKKIFNKNDSNHWKTFAWGFLKVCGKKNKINIGQNLRLQLYYPRKNNNIELKELYSWWKSGSRSKYPSTLYVSLFSISKKHLKNSDFQRAVRNGIFSPSCNESDKDRMSFNLKEDKSVKWDRKPYSSCKVPNEIIHEFPIRSPGSLCVKFSPGGTKLLYSANNTIHLYNVIDFTMLIKFEGHLGLIYDLSWNSSSDKILSASADCTARVWNLADYGRGNLNENKHNILVHPSYVYTAKWVPKLKNKLVTGCFDHIIRVWYKSDDPLGDYNCVQELTQHYGFVNALCFSNDCQNLYSGDEKGILCVWRIQNHATKVLVFQEEVVIDEISGNVINYLDYHSAGHRLLIHTRNSQLRLINHKVWKTTHVLQGPLNLRQQVKGCLSPCGNLIFAGGEDSCLYAWNTNSGDICRGLPKIPFLGTITSIDYHPHGNMLALSTLNLNSSSEFEYSKNTNDMNKTNTTLLGSSIMVLGYKNKGKQTVDGDIKSLPVSVMPFENISKNDDNNEDQRTWMDISSNLLIKLDTVLKMTNEN